MHWFSESPSLRQLDPTWPVLPGTALALVPKLETGTELVGAENALAEQMGSARKIDFASGRHCAHLAQQQLGLPPQPILSNEGVPVWPDGQCGSISHSKDWALAAVSTTLRSIGVDVEARGRVTEKLFRTLFRPKEVEFFTDLPTPAPSVAFAAKEAGFKAAFPVGEAYIGFQEASIDLNWQAQRFHIRYHGNHQPNAALESGVGFWRLTDTHVIVVFAIQD